VTRIAERENCPLPSGPKREKGGWIYQVLPEEYGTLASAIVPGARCLLAGDGEASGVCGACQRRVSKKRKPQING